MVLLTYMDSYGYAWIVIIDYFLFVRIRIYGIMVDLQDWDDADALFYGYCLKASMTTPCRFPSGLRIKSAMTGASCPTVPTLWIPA